MKSLLNALQAGRLVELPDTNKAKALEYLANLIEAVPDLPGVPELYEAMLAREQSQNTGIGLGVACPHVRAGGSGDMVCAVGWSPAGIDYGAPDGKRVHLLVMYYIPDAQRNVYLKEISALAGAVQRGGGITPIATAEDIATVRERLLDWVGAAVEASIPEAKARMIRLEARHAVAEGVPRAPSTEQLDVTDVFFVSSEDVQPVILCATAKLLSALQSEKDLPTLVQQRRQFSSGGFRLVFRSVKNFEGSRALYEYLAVKLT
jgi:nitrogen PTS system EIIA component